MLLIELDLFERVEADQDRRDRLIDGGDRFGHAFAEVAFLVAIAQFPRFVLSGARAARDRSSPEPAPIEMDIHFDRRIAARIENLPRSDLVDAGRGHIVRELAALRARRNLSFVIFHACQSSRVERSVYTCRQCLFVRANVCFPGTRPACQSPTLICARLAGQALRLPVGKAPGPEPARLHPGKILGRHTPKVFGL